MRGLEQEEKSDPASPKTHAAPSPQGPPGRQSEDRPARGTGAPAPPTLRAATVHSVPFIRKQIRKIDTLQPTRWRARSSGAGVGGEESSPVPGPRLQGGGSRPALR